MNCNMKCKHCFNGDNLNSPGLLDVEKACYFIEAACREYQDVKVTFHGGEPTLAGIDFYKTIFDFQHEMIKKYKVSFSNNFTTNALMLTDELIDLLVENNALINISFDGPYNDVLRQNSHIVSQKFVRVKEKGGKVRAFCTISKGSYKHLLKIYKWFNEREIDFKILPIEPRGYAAIDKELLMNTTSFIKVLIDVYKYWICDHDCRVRFYTFEEFASLRRDTQFKPFWFSREIALNPDGKIYPFGRPNDIQYCLGEAKTGLKLSDCFVSDEYSRMLRTLDGYRKKYCNDCGSSQVCNGVCICMSYMYVQDEELLLYSCHQSNSIFEAVLKVNEAIMTDFQNGCTDKYNMIIHDKFGKEMS